MKLYSAGPKRSIALPCWEPEGICDIVMVQKVSKVPTCTSISSGFKFQKQENLLDAKVISVTSRCWL